MLQVNLKITVLWFGLDNDCCFFLFYCLKVLAQNRGRKSKDQPPKKAAKKKPEGTVFTEEDFRKFEREYFGRP